MRTLKFLKNKWMIFLIPLSTLIFMIPTDNFHIMLLQVFTVQIMLIYLYVSVFFTILRKWYAAAASYASFLILLLYLMPYMSSDIDSKGPVDITVSHFNVLKYNTDYNNITQLALQSNADIISFQEIDSVWESQLVLNLSDTYPYQHIHSKDADCYGLAIFSKYPLVNKQIFHFNKMPNLTGQMQVNSNLINYLASHTRSPRTYHFYKERNEHIKIISDRVSKMQGTVISLGDFNAVPWDSVIQAFTKETGLKNSRSGIAGTYPSWSPMRIPIDYIFHSADLRCSGFKTIKSSRSDHLGITGKYYFIEKQHAKICDLLNN